MKKNHTRHWTHWGGFTKKRKSRAKQRGASRTQENKKKMGPTKTILTWGRKGETPSVPTPPGENENIKKKEIARKETCWGKKGGKVNKGKNAKRGQPVSSRAGTKG